MTRFHTLLALSTLSLVACTNDGTGSVTVCIDFPDAATQSAKICNGTSSATVTSVPGSTVKVHVAVTLTAGQQGGGKPGGAQGSLQAHVYVDGFAGSSSTGGSPSEATLVLTLNDDAATYSGVVTLNAKDTSTPGAATICAEVVGERACSKLSIEPPEVPPFLATIAPFPSSATPPLGTGLYEVSLTGLTGTSVDLPVSFTVLGSSDTTLKSLPLFQPPTGKIDGEGHAKSYVFLSDSDKALISITVGPEEKRFFIEVGSLSVTPLTP